MNYFLNGPLFAKGNILFREIEGTIHGKKTENGGYQTKLTGGIPGDQVELVLKDPGAGFPSPIPAGKDLSEGFVLKGPDAGYYKISKLLLATGC